MCHKLKVECPVCHYRMDSHTQISGEEGGGPEEGSYSICIKCAVLLVFNADLSVHIATDKEMSELQTNAKEAFSKLKMAQRYILHQTRKN